MKKTLEIIPLFLLTIPLFLVLHIEKEYRNIIQYKFVSSDILELFSASILIAGFFFVLVRNFRIACVYAFPVIIIFYFFCDVKDQLHEWDNTSFISSYSFLLPAVLTVLFLIFFILRKTKSEFKRFYLFVNVTFLTFIIFEIAAMVIGNPTRKDNLSNQSFNATSYQACDSCVHPDIYYIVFDAYTSSEVLSGEFNYDNSRIDSFLKAKGFYLVMNSRSNYNLTPFSIGATFNSDYLRSLNTNKDYFMDEYLPGISFVRNNQLIPILREEGYQIFNHSIFDFKEVASTIAPYDLWELNLLYERHNIFRKINKDIGYLLWPSIYYRKFGTSDKKKYAAERDRFLSNTLEELRRTIQIKIGAPKFTYAHFLLPHGPYTYDSSGISIPYEPKSTTAEEDKRGYINQLVYTNKIMQLLVEEIFLHSDKPVAIILQGDHGHRYHTPEKKDLEFPNLNAWYFYNRDYKLLNDSLSNVNTFRVIFNSFFKKNYPLLKDTSYFLQYR